MRTLLTGAGGLMGNAIKADIRAVRRITEGTVNVRASWSADLLNFDEVQNMIACTRPSHVIHCAAKVGGVGANSKSQGTFFYENSRINLNVLESAKIYGVKNVLSVLSTCIYPAETEYPLTEANIHNGEPHETNYGYAYAKRVLDIQSRAYREQWGLNYSCVIPTNTYGKHDNFNLEDSHVVPGLIHKCYLAKRDNTDFKVWGSGKPLREFVYSEDMGELIEWASYNYDESEPIILTHSQEISIADLVGIIAEAMDFKGNIVFGADGLEGQYRKPSSNDKLKSYLPDFKFTPIEKGIKETVDWFIANYETCRK